MPATHVVFQALNRFSRQNANDLKSLPGLRLVYMAERRWPLCRDINRDKIDELRRDMRRSRTPNGVDQGVARLATTWRLPSEAERRVFFCRQLSRSDFWRQNSAVHKSLQDMDLLGAMATRRLH